LKQDIWLDAIFSTRFYPQGIDRMMKSLWGLLERTG